MNPGMLTCICEVFLIIHYVILVIGNGMIASDSAYNVHFTCFLICISIDMLTGVQKKSLSQFVTQMSMFEL